MGKCTRSLVSLLVIHALLVLVIVLRTFFSTLQLLRMLTPPSVVKMAALRFLFANTYNVSGLNLIQLFSLSYTNVVYEGLVYEDSA